MRKDLIYQSYSFIKKNIFTILLITLLFLVFTIIVVTHNIKFDKKKTVIDKVIVIEKFKKNNLNLAKNKKTIKSWENNYYNNLKYKTY